MAVLGLGFGLTRQALDAAPWAPQLLKPVFYTGALTPGLRLWQDAAGQVSPASLPGQAVARLVSLGGARAAVQSSAAARPILVRWPAGGRSNLLEMTEDLTQIPWNRTAFGNGTAPVVTARPGSGPGGSLAHQLDLNRGTANLVGDRSILGQRRVSQVGEVLSGAVWLRAARAEDIGRLVRVEISVTGGGAVNHILTAGWAQVILAGRIATAANTSLNIEARGTHTAAELSVLMAQPQLNSGAVLRPFQAVQGPQDVAEPGRRPHWHLLAEPGDSLPLLLPAGSYTRASADPLGMAQFDAITSNGSRPVELLTTPRTADLMILPGSPGEADRARLIAWWQRRFRA